MYRTAKLIYLMITIFIHEAYCKVPEVVRSSFCPAFNVQKYTIDYYIP